MCLGLGNTDIIEDQFQTLRNRESRDVLEQKRKLRRQYLIGVKSQVLSMRQLSSGGPPAEQRPPSDVPGDAFTAKSHTPCLNLDALTGPLSWSAFTPGSSASVISQLFLIRHCVIDAYVFKLCLACAHAQWWS